VRGNVQEKVRKKAQKELLELREELALSGSMTCSSGMQSTALVKVSHHHRHCKFNRPMFSGIHSGFRFYASECIKVPLNCIMGPG